MLRCLAPAFAAFAAALTLPALAAAELTFDPSHPGFAGAAVETFPPAESPIGAQNVTLNRPGVDIGLSTVSPAGLFECFNGNCNLLVTHAGPTRVTFDPPVPVAGISVRFTECRPTLTFTGTSGTEEFQFPQLGSHSFVGALNIGAISEMVIVDCYAFFDDLAYVVGDPQLPPEATDLGLAKTGPLLFTGDEVVSYGLQVTNQGPPTALGTNVFDFVPPQLTFESGFPNTELLAGGRIALTHFGDLQAGGSDAGLLRPRTPPFGVGTFCESVLTNVALVTSANLELDRTNNLAVSTAYFDKSTRTASGEICGNGVDDNCNGRADCWDGCNCWPAIVPGTDGTECAQVAPPGLPPEVVLSFGFCAPGGQSADQHQCRVPRGVCGDAVVPPWCCDAATFSDPENNGRLSECNLGIPGCAPEDPNFKEASPAVNVFGYGYALPGQPITYRVQYENVGNADAHDVEIVDALHPDLDADSLVVNDGGRYDAATRTLRWTDPVLPPQVPRRVTFSARLRADAPPGTRVRNVGTIVFPDAVPPTRIDTNFVEHVVADPARPVAPRLRVLGCDAGAVRLVNEGVGFAYNASAEILNPPLAVQVTDGSVRFAHPDDPEPDSFATVIPSATTVSRDGVSFTTETPSDPCPALLWRVRWESFDGQQFVRDVQSAPDGDRDAVADGGDNCPAVYNPTQADGDADGTGDACEQTSGAPICTGARASLPRLWPPDHKPRLVTPVGVTDPDGDPLTLTITSVRQDEPVDGCGDGDTAPDALILGAQAKVRSERMGGGSGRVYHLAFTAKDPTGGACSGTVTTCVPKSAASDECVDGGPLFDSTSKR